MQISLGSLLPDGKNSDLLQGIIQKFQLMGNRVVCTAFLFWFVAYCLRRTQLTPGSPAARIGLRTGDEIVEIASTSTLSLTYQRALDLINSYDDSLLMTVERYDIPSYQWRMDQMEQLPPPPGTPIHQEPFM